MNLIIDIGNTQTKLVAFKNGEPASEVITCDNTLSALPAFLAQYACEQGIVSTVITLSPEAEAQLHALPFTVLRFTSTTPVPIRVAYRTPQTLGVDRIAAVVGAVTIKANRNLLVIDVGTCITYELVDAAGVYQGGNISPGIKIRLNALHQYTGLLPL
ncbi:MAG: type III pantothenate kinase, partial [Bacteroidaceae bacterium]